MEVEVLGGSIEVSGVTWDTGLGGGRGGSMEVTLGSVLLPALILYCGDKSQLFCRGCGS